jgi:hypothetical protein
MQSGPIANSLAFIEYDLAIINTDYGPELVVNELLPAVFDVFRESDPVTIASVIFSRSNTLNFRVWSRGNCFSTPSLPTMTAPSSRQSRESLGIVERAQLHNQRLRRIVALQTAAGEDWLKNLLFQASAGLSTGQQGHRVRKSTPNSGQMGRIGQK